MSFRIARKLARMTQRQISEKSGIDLSSISGLETGRRSLAQANTLTIAALASALQVTPEELLSVCRQRADKSKRRRRRLPLTTG